jgi:hypothetical protein
MGISQPPYIIRKDLPKHLFITVQWYLLLDVESRALFPSSGRNHVYLTGRGGTATILGAHIAQYFSTQAAATDFRALYPVVRWPITV